MSAPTIEAQVPVRSLEITREDLVRYAGGADDYVRQHWDHPFMIESGFPDVVVHGWLTFAHICRTLEAWLPPSKWAIASYAVRYVRTTYPGTITMGGEVVGVDASGTALSLWSKNAEGEVTTTAQVTVRRR